MRDAPGDTEALSGDIDARRDDERGLHSLGEDGRDVLKIHSDRLASAVGDIHADDPIVDRNLHAEAGRVLARGNPLAIDALHTRAEELLHDVGEDLAGARLAEPLGAVRRADVQELLLHVQEEVVEAAEIACGRIRALLGIGVTALERERHLVGGPVLGVPDVDSEGIHGLGDANLEALAVVLDRNRLATRLVHADIAERDLGSVEVRDRDDGRGRHCVRVYLALPADPPIRFQSIFLN